MVTELMAIALLMGKRRERLTNIEAVVDGIMKVSAVVTDLPDIRELDVNLIKVMSNGVLCPWILALYSIPRDKVRANIKHT